MHLKEVKLQHYRNYDHIHLFAEAGVNIFLGKNAQGKTNILEAMFVSALTKSHRTSKDKDLIQWNAEQATIHCEVERRLGTANLDLIFSNKGKKAKVNGLEKRKLSEFIGTLNAVMFAPEDLSIVKGNPSVRRKFIDMEIGQISPNYIYHLSQYQKVLVQRNNLLKQNPASALAMIDIWNEQMAGLAVKILKKRKQFMTKLQGWAKEIHTGISNGQEALEIMYEDSAEIESLEDETVAIDRFMIKLSQVKEQEFRRGVSLIGPHRDDLSFYINGKNVHDFGSQGQQRTTALSLKLAEIELIHQEVGEYPILLLDDVLSELDPYRQSQLLQTIFEKVQTFVTTTSIDGIDEATLSKSALFHVNQGKIHREQ